eukprot:7443099-Pyramimonas_sp.AAC.1
MTLGEDDRRRSRPGEEDRRRNRLVPPPGGCSTALFEPPSLAQAAERLCGRAVVWPHPFHEPLYEAR